MLVEHARDELDLLAGEPEARLLPLSLEVFGSFLLEDPDHFRFGPLAFQILQEGEKDAFIVGPFLLLTLILH